MRGEAPNDQTMVWDYESYATVKMGLAQPPTWSEWANMPWRTAKRWLEFENLSRERERAEREEQKARSGLY